MVLKILLLNFPREEILNVPGNVSIAQMTIEDNPTLHDFHAILMDTTEILNNKWWKHDRYSSVYVAPEKLKGFNGRVKEQIETGGVTFCFSSNKFSQENENYFSVRVVARRYWSIQ